MHTEAEALKRWCPFARQLLTLETTHNGNPISLGSANRLNDGKVCLCIGAGCMAWRWVTPVDERAIGTAGIGYCGLAGKP